MDERIQELHKEYTDIPIPDELDLIVNRSIKQSLKANRKNTQQLSGWLVLELPQLFF